MGVNSHGKWTWFGPALKCDIGVKAALRGGWIDGRRVQSDGAKDAGEACVGPSLLSTVGVSPVVVLQNQNNSVLSVPGVLQL